MIDKPSNKRVIKLSTSSVSPAAIIKELRNESTAKKKSKVSSLWRKNFKIRTLFVVCRKSISGEKAHDNMNSYSYFCKFHAIIAIATPHLLTYA